MSRRLDLFGNYPKLESYDDFEGLHVVIRLLVPEISFFLLTSAQKVVYEKIPNADKQPLSMLLFYKVYKIDLCKNFEDHFFLLTWYEILVLAA